MSVCDGCKAVADESVGLDITDPDMYEIVEGEHKRFCEGPGCVCQHRPRDRRDEVKARA